MWWYNILGYNEVRISHILWVDPINAWSILLTTKLVALKRENYEPILALKITEWRKLVDYFGYSIEADLSRVIKKNIYIVHIRYIPRSPSLKIRISRQNMDKYFNL